MSTIHTDLPLPNKPLGQHCSALVNGTLYTFTGDAFQSLHLGKGEKWKELPLLFGTRGAACVHAHQDTAKEALYIIGGTSSNATMVPEIEYKGVQRYTFKTGKWEVIPIADPIAYNMTKHGAVFLKDTQEILLFSGTRWPDEWTPSAMAFLIQTVPPYVITAVSAVLAPPLLAPIVLPWGNDSALIVGGSAANTNLITYSPREGWRDLGIQLKEGLPVGKAGATLVDGDDGSRMLLTFDMSTSPVKFTRTKVKEPTVGSSGGKKGLTEANWPTYNGTYAPKKADTGFALTADAGMLVFSGGDDKAPLCIFHMRKNRWEDPTSIFSQQDGADVAGNEKGDGGLRTLPSPTPTPTNTPAPVPVPQRRGLNNIQLLFIVLGAALGAFFILSAALYYLRRYKKGRGAAGLGRSNTTRSKMSFQDRGLGFMKETGPMDDLPPPQEPQRGSGWSKYFSGGSATNLVNLPSRTYSTGTRRSSVYDINDSAIDPNRPLDPRRAGSLGGKPAASVRSAGLELDLPGATLNVNPQHFSANRMSDASMSSLGASSYSSGIPESILEKTTWDPTGSGGGSTGGMVGSSTGRYGEVQNSPRSWVVVTDNRVASSIYPESAVTVYPDGYGNPDSSRPHGGISRNESVRATDMQNDVSWLNLRV